MKNMLIAVLSGFYAIPSLAQTVNTTYYNANGSFGGSSRTTTFGNQTTTQHYGANGMPAGRSVTTTFGNQTTTRHYNQNGLSAGTTTQFINGKKR